MQRSTPACRTMGDVEADQHDQQQRADTNPATAGSPGGPGLRRSGLAGAAAAGARLTSMPRSGPWRRRSRPSFQACQRFSTSSAFSNHHRPSARICLALFSGVVGNRCSLSWGRRAPGSGCSRCSRRAWRTRPAWRDPIHSRRKNMAARFSAGGAPLGDHPPGDVEEALVEAVTDPLLPQGSHPAVPGVGVLDLVVDQELPGLGAGGPPDGDVRLDPVQALEGPVQVHGIQLVGGHAVGQRGHRQGVGRVVRQRRACPGSP